jgi:hypothetical protein
VETAHGKNEDVLNEGTAPDHFWEETEIGDPVRLEQPGWPPLEGFVEDKTPSGDIVWVVSVGDRRLFHKTDGYSLVVSK